MGTFTHKSKRAEVSFLDKWYYDKELTLDQADKIGLIVQGNIQGYYANNSIWLLLKETLFKEVEFKELMPNFVEHLQKTDKMVSNK